MDDGYTTPVSPLDDPYLKWTDEWVKVPGGKVKKLGSIPNNRANRRAARFGGVRAEDGSIPARSRIQRGISRPGQRGTVLRNGLQPIFIDPETGEIMDMAEFAEQLEKSGVVE